MNARTPGRIGTLLLPLLAVFGILLLRLAHYFGGATLLAAFVGGISLTVSLAAIAIGAVPFGTEVERRPVEA